MQSVTLTPRLLLLAASVAGAAACAGAGPQDLTPSAARVLQTDSARVAGAARAHDVARLGSALQQLRQDVFTLQRKGHVGGARAQRILDAATLVAQDVPRPTKPSSTTPTTGPTITGSDGKGENQDEGDGG